MAFHVGIVNDASQLRTRRRNVAHIGTRSTPSLFHNKALHGIALHCFATVRLYYSGLLLCVRSSRKPLLWMDIHITLNYLQYKYGSVSGCVCCALIVKEKEG